jgi:hypothetical protein
MNNEKIPDPLKTINNDDGEDPSCLVYNVREKGDRRSGIDRRLFSYEGYIPERRSGEERRGDLRIRKTI